MCHKKRMDVLRKSAFNYQENELSLQLQRKSNPPPWISVDLTLWEGGTSSWHQTQRAVSLQVINTAPSITERWSLNSIYLVKPFFLKKNQSLINRLGSIRKWRSHTFVTLNKSWITGYHPSPCLKGHPLQDGPQLWFCIVLKKKGFEPISKI